MIKLLNATFPVQKIIGTFFVLRRFNILRNSFLNVILSANLKVYRRYTSSQYWTQIPEKTSSDIFNGIEAVRFDYTNNSAYVSTGFSFVSDYIYIAIVNETNNSTGAAYSGIPKYYDDREMALTSTLDDWCGDELCTPYPTHLGSWNQFVNITKIRISSIF